MNMTDEKFERAFNCDVFYCSFNKTRDCEEGCHLLQIKENKDWDIYLCIVGKDFFKIKNYYCLYRDENEKYDEDDLTEPEFLCSHNRNCYGINKKQGCYKELCPRKENPSQGTTQTTLLNFKEYLQKIKPKEV